MGILKTYFRYMQDPVEGMRLLMARRSFRQACLGYFIAALSWVLFFNIGAGLSVLALLFKICVLFLAEMTAGYFAAALCGLFLDLCRIKVSSAQLFVMIGSSGLIKSLLIAFALVCAAFPQMHLGWFSPLAILGVFILQLVYLVRGLKVESGTDSITALGSWLFGFIPVGVLLLLMGIFFIWFLVLLF